jgi:type III secretion system YscI/HrpB-like protein
MTIATMSINDSVNMLNDNMISSNDLEVMDMNSSQSFLENKVSGLVDDISSSHNFLQNVMKKGHAGSPREMLEVQHKLHQFSLMTQLASKVASTIVKNVDTLTKIQ